MSEIGKIGSFLLSPLLTLTGVIGGKAKTPAAQAVPTPVVDQSAAAAAAAAARTDEIRRRRGAGANELTGGGAEATTPGAKVLLGQ